MKSIDLKLDWLSFTFKPDRDEIKKAYNVGNPKGFEHFYDDLVDSKSDIDLFFEYFPEFAEVQEEFLILSGYSHYENVMGFMGVSDTCRISYNTEGYSSVDMGVNVSVPSHGLEWLFGLFDIDIDDDAAVQKLFVILKERYCHCSRIDLAFDDYSKKFRPKKYIGWWFMDMIRSKFKKMNTSSSLRENGHTFYLGSRTTGKMLRIYDKDIESNGTIDAVRYEFELHMKYSRDMFNYIIENGCVNFISYLRSYFEVINLDDSNRSRCSLNEEWSGWLAQLDFCEELPEKVDIPQYTLAQRKSEVTTWFLNACVRSIKGYAAVFGWQNLQEYVRQDSRPIPDKYRLLLDSVQSDDDWINDACHYKYSFDYEGVGDKDFSEDYSETCSQDWLGRNAS